MFVCYIDECVPHTHVCIRTPGVFNFNIHTFLVRCAYDIEEESSNSTTIMHRMLNDISTRGQQTTKQPSNQHIVAPLLSKIINCEHHHYNMITSLSYEFISFRP